MFKSDSQEAGILQGIFGVAGPTTGQIGSTCSPITAIGVSGSSW